MRSKYRETGFFIDAENSAMKLPGHFYFALLTILVLVSCPGCASTAKQEGMRKYFDDGILPTKVKAAVFHAPASQSAGIGNETFHGT